MKIKPNGLRHNNGFSVLYVITISAIALMATMAVMDALVSTRRNVATQVYASEATSVAENSLQYALALLNDAAAQGKLASFTSPISIPPTISGSGQVVVTMTQIPSSLFITPPITGATPIYTSPWIGNPLTTDYRLLTAQAKFNNFSRTINVIVGANSFAASTSPPQTSTPYFTEAIFANQKIDVSGTSVSFENGSLPASQPILSSNTQIKLRGSTIISGTVSAPSFDLPKINVVSNIVTTPVIYGNVSYSGSTPLNIKPDLTGFTPDANVYGDGINGSKPGEVTGNASTQQAPPIQVQTPSAPTNFTPDGASGMIINSSTSQPSDLGALNFAAGQNLSIIAGQYVASSIYTSPTSTVNVTQSSGAKTAAPVQLYLQGDAQNSTVLQLQGSINSSGSASNLQIFYNGTQAIQVSKGEFHGQIYAPNAPVTIDTSGGDFHGAVVASNVVLQGTGKFYFDPTTVSTKGGTTQSAPGAGYVLSKNNGATPSSFYVLSWQEKTTGAP